MRSVLLAIFAMCGACAPLQVEAPPRASEAVDRVLEVYSARYPRALVADPRITWFRALALPDCGWHRACTQECEIRISTDRSDVPSASDLAHELLHCVQDRPTPDQRWSDNDWDLLERAQEDLRRHGL